MGDTELLKDLSSLGKPPSFDAKDTMLVNTAVDRKEILPLREQVLSPSWSESERTRQSHQRNGQSGEPAHRDAADKVHLLISLLRYSDKFRREPLRPNTEFFKLTVNICRQQLFKLIDLAHEITVVKVAKKTGHKFARTMLQRRRQSRMTPRTETRISHLVSAKRH